MTRKLLPDPENAKVAVARYKELNGSLSKSKERALFELASHSRFLGNAAIKDPEILQRISSRDFLKDKKSLENFLNETTKLQSKVSSPEELMRQLRIYKYREFSRIVYRDIKRICSFSDVMEELSDLASSVVEASFIFFKKQLKLKKNNKFVVLAMGKLGERLLNLSSDIDLIYIYEAESNPDPIFKLAENLTKSLSAITEDGFLYRVDLGLRPGGGKSTVVVSYEGAVEHYFYWGDTWERAALIKARPIACDISLGNRFLKEIDSFIYKKSLDYASIEDLKDMKTKLDTVKKSDDVKLGKGGIREIEFFVQAHQLVNAGEFNELKGLNVLQCADKLNEIKILDNRTQKTLKDSYIFLRRVEHSIQIVDELQTQKIPLDNGSLLKLSKRVGLDNSRKFQKKYSETTQAVSEIYNKLFYDPSDKLEEEGNEFWKLADFLTEGNIKEEDARKTLTDLGFKYPDGAIDIISHLIDSKRGALTEKGRIFTRRVIPAFLASVIKSYDPDSALRNLERFISGIGWRTTIYAVLTENPEILKLLSRLFSTSGVLSNFLIKHPEYLDILTLKDVRTEYTKVDQMIDRLNEAVDDEKDYEDKLDALRHFKHVETLKLCLRDLNNEVDTVYVGKYLSMLAKAVLNVGFKLAISVTKNRKKKTNLKNMVILGMGKFGGNEMSYNSDLDLIFIYEGGDHETFSKLGQRIISIMSVPTGEGYCYKVDLDLRPSGRSGALVTSFESFKNYHKESAQLWERQALIRAVPVAGDKSLAKRVIKTVDNFIYQKHLEKDFYKEIDKLRVRMEKELANENFNKLNLKTGKGGLVDVEFVVQMLQLRYGKDNQNVRCRNTLDALEELKDKKIVKLADAKRLEEGYLFLKRMENLLRLLHDRSISELKESDFDRLTIELEEFKNTDDLKKNYRSITENIRKIYEGFFH